MYFTVFLNKDDDDDDDDDDDALIQHTPPPPPAVHVYPVRYFTIKQTNKTSQAVTRFNITYHSALFNLIQV